MSDMSRKEAIDWLCRLRSHVPTFMPKIWQEKIIKALDFAIASLETDEAYQLEYERTTKNDLGVDCISRQAVLDGFEKYSKGSFAYGCVWDYVKNLPSVTPQEPKTGHWNEIPKYKDIAWRCSECEHFTTMKHNFCPNCGADMREVEE